MQLPFGKWRGYPLREVPEDYFRWLAGEEWLREPLKSAVQMEIEHRVWTRWMEEAFRARSMRSPIPTPFYVDAWAAQEIVRAGFRVCVGSWHPDKGGDGRVMTRINLARDWLVETIQQALPPGEPVSPPRGDLP